MATKIKKILHRITPQNEMRGVGVNQPKKRQTVAGELSHTHCTGNLTQVNTNSTLLEVRLLSSCQVSK